MAVQHFKFGQYNLVREYFYKPILPPPFVIFSWIRYVCNYLIAIYRWEDHVSISQESVRQSWRCVGGVNKKPAKISLRTYLSNFYRVKMNSESINVLSGRKFNSKLDHFNLRTSKNVSIFIFILVTSS